MRFRADQFARFMPSVPAGDYGAAAEANGTAVDCQGYNECLVYLDCGTFAATGDVSAHVEHSTDNSTWADVTGATFSEKDNTEDATHYQGRINLNSVNRYLRLVYDVDDDTVDIAGGFILLHPKYGPATPVNTLEFNIA